MRPFFPNRFARRARIRTLAAALLVALAGPALADDKSTFTAENSAAMDAMMAGMAVQPSGDVDRDFAAMMIPHHRGAIDMALAELRHGRNEQLRRIAQEIIVDQQQEIDAMRLALGQAPSTPAPAPTQVGVASSAAPASAANAHVHSTH